jgi:hypothetical protein
MQKQIDVFTNQMTDKPRRKIAQGRAQRVRLTAQVTLAAYDAISEIQRRHRHKTGKALRLWEILDAAIRTYAKKQGIAIGE